MQLYCDQCGCVLSDTLANYIAAIYSYGVNAYRNTTLQWGRGFFHGQARLFLYNELDGCHTYVPIRSEPILVGRGSASYLPSSYVDLSEFGARQFGVARYHAQIEQKSNALYLSDLESPTGTFLDGVPLKPHTAYMIHNWSQIVFGTLAMRVRFA
ncbi:MAG: FHA domain-containing protein [Anaerolineae bacterium]|nr:FHA domain-containing protein [Anaerolineae bacterium]